MHLFHRLARALRAWNRRAFLASVLLVGAPQFAAAQSRDVAVSVSGIETIAAYAAVTAYLESLESVQAVLVEQVTPDTVIYRLRTAVDPGELGRTLELNTALR